MTHLLNQTQHNRFFIVTDDVSGCEGLKNCVTTAHRNNSDDDDFDNIFIFPTGGYYTIEQSHSKLRIVVLNSNLWAGGASRSDAHAHSHARAQWKWLEGVLDKTRKQHEMVSWGFGPSCLI